MGRPTWTRASCTTWCFTGNTSPLWNYRLYCFDFVTQSQSLHCCGILYSSTKIYAQYKTKHVLKHDWMRLNAPGSQSQRSTASLHFLAGPVGLSLSQQSLLLALFPPHSGAFQGWKKFNKMQLYWVTTGLDSSDERVFNCTRCVTPHRPSM